MILHIILITRLRLDRVACNFAGRMAVVLACNPAVGKHQMNY